MFFVFGRALGAVMFCTAMSIMLGGAFVYLDLLVPKFVVGEKGAQWQVHAHEGDNVEELTNEAAVLAVR